MKPDRCCRTCMWWSNTLPPLATRVDRPENASPDLGVCQAEPPKVTTAGLFDDAVFPMTHAGRVCAWWDGGDDDDDGGPGEEAEAGNVVPFREAA